MPRSRRYAPLLLAVAAALLLGALGWYALRLAPDRTLIGPDVQVRRLPGGTGAIGPAEVVLDFTRASKAYAALNLGLDLNGDGRIADYSTVGGAVQHERIAADEGVQVTLGPRSYPFAIADPDVVTRNNFKLVAVLTARPIGAWSGETPLGSAAFRAVVSAIIPARP